MKKSKKIKNVLCGIVLIAVGVMFALNTLEITNIDIFFEGWWTLFIIIPCTVSLFTERDKTGNIVGILIGVCLLLCCQGIMDFSMLWKLLLPAIIVIVGIKMIYTGIFNKKENEIIIEIKNNDNKTKNESAIFSGYDVNYDGQVFEGAEYTAIFGGVECDLRNAIIQTDCVIKVTVLFGSVDIFVPKNVNVKVNSNCIFGGVSNKTSSNADAPTIYISGTCIFGGVDIK